MANIRKQFNFRNGVQVDDDNLVVSPTGLVGIGTTIPTEILDVRGTAKVVGLVTANQIYTPDLTALSVNIDTITLGESIIGGGVSISSGIITASGSGVVTYYGDGGSLLNLPTSQWLDVDAGLGFTSIYSQGYVGVGTDDPRFLFQISGTNDTTVVGFTSGVGFSSEGNILATGIVTAYKFIGIGSDLTELDASEIAYGTISNDRIPVLLNSKMPANISVSGIITASGGLVGNLTGNVTGDLTGNVVGDLSGNVTGDLTGNVTGNVVGIASTARSLTGTPDIEVGNITASRINVGHIDGLVLSGITTLPNTVNVGSGGEILSVLNGNIGIGTSIPSSSVQIQKTSVADVEILSETTESKITLGQGIGVGNSAAVIRFGNAIGSFELLNRDIGNFNMYLHAGNTGLDTGRFGWIYGQNNDEIMSLTYEGRLGLGRTNPDNTLHVVGTSTVTGDAYFGGNVSILGNLDISGGSVTLPSLFVGNVYSTSGISTVYDLKVENIAEVTSIGIGTTNPIQDIDARSSIALFSQVGLGSTNPVGILDVVGECLFTNVGIGTTTSGGNALVVGNPDFGGIVVYDSSVEMNNTSIVMDDQSNVGVGTTFPRCAVDFADAGTNLVGGAYRYMLPPRLTTSEIVGLSTVAGAFIFNLDTLKFQGYTGVAWTDFH
jgi:hypothetical protein